jgi:hypothetical protein
MVTEFIVSVFGAKKVKQNTGRNGRLAVQFVFTRCRKAPMSSPKLGGTGHKHQFWKSPFSNVICMFKKNFSNYSTCLFCIHRGLHKMYPIKLTLAFNINLQQNIFR